MKAIACKKCNSVIESKEPGTYYCETCGKNMKFFKIEAFCGAKPNELNENDDEK